MRASLNSQPTMIVLMHLLLEGFVDVEKAGSSRRQNNVKNAFYSFGIDLLWLLFAQLGLANGIRDLKRWRDEIPQSKAVDVNELEDRLK